MEKIISERLLKAIDEIVGTYSKEQRQDFSDESKLITIYCSHLGEEPREVAKLFNERYISGSDGISFDGNRVIKQFGQMHMGGKNTRIAIFKDAIKAGDLLIKALEEENLELLDEKYEELMKGSENKPKIALMYMFDKNSQLSKLPCRSIMYKLNKRFAKKCMAEIKNSVNETPKTVSKDIKPEEYEQEIIRLQENLNRANRMVESLQEDLAEQENEIKSNMLYKFMSDMNSIKYNNILDMMAQAQKGLRKMRSNKKQIPEEIADVALLIRKLAKFVEDCGIEMIADVGDEFSIGVKDVGNYDYEGSEFANDDETKNVTVMTPGWIIYEQDTVISNPKVKEIE